MIFTQDLAGRLTSINAAGQKFLGRTQEELIGTSFFSVFGIIPDNGFAGSLPGRRRQEFRHQFVAHSANGEDRWLDRCFADPRSPGRDDRFSRSRARRHRAKRFEEALRDSEERYRLCLNRRRSRSGSTTKTRSPSRSQRSSDADLRLQPRRVSFDDRQRFRPQEDIPTLMIKNASTRTNSSFRVPGVTKRATKTIYVEMSSHPVVFDGKNSKLVIVNDVTERKLLDEKQQRLRRCNSRRWSGGRRSTRSTFRF